MLELSLETFLQVVSPTMSITLYSTILYNGVLIQRKRSVSGFSVWPFASALLNGFVWLTYGYLRDDISVALPGVFGFCVGLVCSFIYIRHSKLSHFRVWAFVILTICAATVCAVYGFRSAVGYMGSSLIVILLASPLAAISAAIKDKSAATLPLAMSCVGWINAASWFSYGIFVASDPKIYIPHVLGLSLTTIQLGLHTYLECCRKRVPYIH
mmetsp:Transcript_25439/g.37504  ORF Transcript_25439/g.37504 Transcript_25439/m.37504 type:complete len:212 (+) Transcript_25439:56-691(+)